VTNRGQGERRAIPWIACDRLVEGTECIANPLSRREREQNRERTQIEIVSI
jgi:hypothetical protein